MFPTFLKNIFKKRKKVVVILGQTATGKTSLSIDVAHTINGEIISADSRQIYKGLDIGSAKITHQEMGGIPHYMIDIANPLERYTAQEYVHEATGIITDIHQRNKVPIICGGTGQYIDALIYQHQFPNIPPNPSLRNQLEKLTVEELFKQLQEREPKRALSIDRYNKVRLVRALEINNAQGSFPKHSKNSPYDVIFIGLEISQEVLHQRIHQRIIERLNQGMLNEAHELLSKGIPHERLEEFGLEYRYMSRYIRGLISHDEMVRELATATRQFAKRQKTWFKRNKKIQWFNPLVEKNIIMDIVQKFIKK